MKNIKKVNINEKKPKQFEDTCAKCSTTVYFDVKNGRLDHRHHRASGEACRLKTKVNDSKIFDPTPTPHLRHS